MDGGVFPGVPSDPPAADPLCPEAGGPDTGSSSSGSDNVLADDSMSLAAGTFVTALFSELQPKERRMHARTEMRNAESLTPALVRIENGEPPSFLQWACRGVILVLRCYFYSVQ